jgi:hypothetical protein
MFVIRNEVMRHLEEQLRLDFRHRLRAHLEETLARDGVTVSEDELLRQADEGIARARAYHLVRECDVARFTEIVCRYLGGFTERPLPPAARSILYDHRAGPGPKLDRLEQWAGSEARGR